jgi:protein SCO1/2
MPRAIASLIARLLLLLGAAFLLAACGDGAPPPFRNTDITGASFGSEFPQPLTDHRGQARQLKDFRGKAVILFFGYTHCPDVCPTALARFAEAVKQLGPAGGRVQVLFVSIDPERDSPARLADYVPWFNPAFLGLTGSPEAVAAAAKEFRIYAARQEVGGALGYVMDHTAGAYVYDPAGRLRLFVKDDAPIDGLVADLRRLLDA